MGQTDNLQFGVWIFKGGYSGGYSEVDIHYWGNWIFKIGFWRGE